MSAELPIYCALKRLVDLKNHKSLHGKNNWYIKNQKGAWEQSVAALNMEDGPATGNGKPQEDALGSSSSAKTPNQISDYLAELHQQGKIDCISISVEQITQEIAAMGATKTAFDSSPANYSYMDLVNPPQQREIPADASLHDVICDALADSRYLYRSDSEAAWAIVAATRSYLRTTEPVSIIDAALENAAEILANFKGEPDNSKLEQWQACYAKLFTQMNELVQSTKSVSVDSKRGEFAPIKTEQPDDWMVAFEASFNAVLQRSGKTDDTCHFHDVGALKGFVLPIWQDAWDANLPSLDDVRGILAPMRESRLQKTEALLRHARSLCSVRYQAYQYVKEGEPGYAVAGDLAVEATQHLRRVEEVIRQAEDMLPANTDIEGQS